MWVAFLGWALAAPPEVAAVVNGRPMEIRSSLAIPNPRYPGMFSVVLSASELTCQDLAGRYGVLFFDPPGQPVAVAQFISPTAGAKAERFAAFDAPFFADFVGDVVLSSAATTAGQVGVVTFDVTADAGSMKGQAAFSLCESIPSVPSLAGTTFSVEEVLLGDEKDIRVQFPAPNGWDRSAIRRSTTWTAPDGETRLHLNYSEDVSDASWTKLIQDWQGRSVAPGWFVSDRSVAMTTRSGEEKGSRVVWQWVDGSTVALMCTIEVTRASSTQVLDALEEACRRMTVTLPAWALVPGGDKAAPQ
jgi:hypothetical protein